MATISDALASSPPICRRKVKLGGEHAATVLGSWLRWRVRIRFLGWLCLSIPYQHFGDLFSALADGVVHGIARCNDTDWRQDANGAI